MSLTRVPPLSREKPIAGRLRRGRALIPRLGFLVLLTSPSAVAAEPLDERAAVQHLCAQGPDAALAAARSLGAEAVVLGASALPNPSLVFEHQRGLSGPSDSESIAGISVPIGLGGRYFLLNEAAAERRTQAHLSAQASLFEAALEFREVYLSAALARARADVMLRHQAVLDELTASLERLRSGGETAGYDVLRQAVDARAHRRALTAAEARSEAERARLEAWLGAPVAIDLTVTTTASEPVSVVPAEVASLEAAARASALEARAAHRRWIPDLQVFAGYREAGTSDEIGRGLALGLTVPIPAFDRGQAEAVRAQAEGAAARAEAERVGRNRRAELAGLRARLVVLGGARDDQGAIAAAEQLQLHARQLYAAGEATITELLDALGAAEAARLETLELRGERAATWLAMMRAAGTFFDPTLDLACRAGVEAPR